MSAGAEFMGGPMSGQLRDFPGDEPPASVKVYRVPPAAPLIYVRQVSQMDDGPLWVYVPESDASPAPSTTGQEGER